MNLVSSSTPFDNFKVLQYKNIPTESKTHISNIKGCTKINAVIASNISLTNDTKQLPSCSPCQNPLNCNEIIRTYWKMTCELSDTPKIGMTFRNHLN